jgi:hypothetical protein
VIQKWPLAQGGGERYLFQECLALKVFISRMPCFEGVYFKNALL